MIDTMTRKPLRVRNEGTAGPYVRLPFSLVEEVRELLEKNGIRYWVEENVISLNGGPEIAVINFGRVAVPEKIQAVLDSVH